MRTQRCLHGFTNLYCPSRASWCDDGVEARRNHPGVVCGQHGWWQPASELGRPGYPAFGEGSANLNLVLSQGPSDPISGSSPLRASLCEVARDNG
jgi:hypothetical protein